MTRRRLLLALLVVLAVLVTAGAVRWAAIPWPGVSRENYERIGVGMRRAEVEAILGGPPTYYIMFDPTTFSEHSSRSRAESFRRWLESHHQTPYLGGGSWVGDEGSIKVDFRDDGTIQNVRIYSNSGPTFWDRLCRRLGL